MQDECSHGHRYSLINVYEGPFANLDENCESYDGLQVFSVRSTSVGRKGGSADRVCSRDGNASLGKRDDGSIG